MEHVARWTGAVVLALVAIAAILAGFAVKVLLDDPGGDVAALAPEPTAIPTATPSPVSTPAASPTSTSTAAPTVRPSPEGASLPEAALRAAIEAAIGDYAPDVSVTVRGANGETVSIAGDRVYYAASLFKLAVLYEAERRISRGELALDDRVVITEEDAAEDLGTLGDLPVAADGSVSVADALAAMVEVSDNASAVTLGHVLGNDAIDATLAGLGLTATSVNTAELPTTSDDVARLMDALATGEGLSAPAAAHARSLLEAQEWRWGIPAGVPDGVVVGNKTGTWDGALHDAAYVESPNGEYVIGVLSDGAAGWDVIARVSAAAWQVLGEPPDGG